MVNHIFNELDRHSRVLTNCCRNNRLIKKGVCLLIIADLAAGIADHIRDDEIEHLKNEVSDLKNEVEELKKQKED